MTIAIPYVIFSTTIPVDTIPSSSDRNDLIYTQLSKKIVGPTFRASIGHWTGPMNLAIYEAWIVYHHQRWGVTDVELDVHWTLVDKMETHFSNPYHTGGAKVKVFGHWVEQNAKRDYNSYTMAMKHAQDYSTQRTLINAKRYGDAFVMNIDPDQFLDSSNFDSVESIFSSNETIAVTFPLFNLNYDICSSASLDFGSLVYQEVKPYGSNFTNDETKDFYTDPGIGFRGKRKYIVRPEHWNKFQNIHDPFMTSREHPVKGIIDMTGRAQDKQHLRLLHLRGKYGIQSDNSFKACTKIHDCYLLDSINNACVNVPADADYHFVSSDVRNILSGYPLFDNIDEFYNNATCYASRYPELQIEYCPGIEPSFCQFSNLLDQYERIGKSKKWTWGCTE